MTIRTSYKEYKFSEEATMWSRIGGTITGFGAFVTLLNGWIVNGILEALFPHQSLMAATVILAFAGTFALIAFCMKMEKKCLQRDIESLTEEQKRELIGKILANRKG